MRLRTLITTLLLLPIIIGWGFRPDKVNYCKHTDNVLCLVDTTDSGGITGEVRDLSQYGHKCTLDVTAKVTGTSCPNDNICYEFGTGTDDNINCGSATELDNLGSLTYVAWIDVDDWQDSAQPRYIISKETSGGNFKNFKLRDTGELGFEVTNASSTEVVEVRSSESTLSLGTAHCVGVTWDGTTSASGTHLYIDGVEPTYQTQTDGTGSERDDSANDFVIGNRDSAATTDRTFDGHIESVAVFSSVLTPTQMYDICTNGLR